MKSFSTCASVFFVALMLPLGAEACKLAAKYTEKSTGSIVYVTQSGSSMELKLRDAKHVGKLSGCTLTIQGFGAKGTIKNNGDVTFSDGEEWVNPTGKGGKGRRGRPQPVSLMQGSDDYAEDCSLSAPDLKGGNDGCCTYTNLCNVGDGDCDNDSQCKGALTCGNNNCAWGDGDDCCQGSEGPDAGCPPDTGMTIVARGCKYFRCQTSAHSQCVATRNGMSCLCPQGTCPMDGTCRVMFAEQAEVAPNSGVTTLQLCAAAGIPAFGMIAFFMRGARTQQQPIVDTDGGGSYLLAA